MDNPFKKRRTELITDRRTLLSLISSVPIEEFFRVDGSSLLDKLTVVVGTPGCGKTTIAQAMEFESMATLCERDVRPVNKQLADTMTLNRFLVDGAPTLIGHRMSMSTNFRDIWELPYTEPVKTALLRAFVQSRAVLGWFRQLDAVRVASEDIEIVMGEGSDSVAAMTGADDAAQFRQYARGIELAIFKIVTALVPPGEEEMAEGFLNTRYDVFEVLKSIRVKRWLQVDENAVAVLRPMVIIDDAHELHPRQFVHLRDWLKSKAMGVSRWLMCRPDVVAPEDYREAMAYEDMAEEGASPGSTRGRDYIMKLMQLGSRDAKRFKPIARDIANRYISGIPELARRSVDNLQLVLDGGRPSSRLGSSGSSRNRPRKSRETRDFRRV